MAFSPEVSISCSVVPDSVIPWTAAHQAPVSMRFSRQEYWSGFPFPSPHTFLITIDLQQVSKSCITSPSNLFFYKIALITRGPLHCYIKSMISSLIHLIFLVTLSLES